MWHRKPLEGTAKLFEIEYYMKPVTAIAQIDPLNVMMMQHKILSKFKSLFLIALKDLHINTNVILFYFKMKQGQKY